MPFSRLYNRLKRGLGHVAATPSLHRLLKSLLAPKPCGVLSDGDIKNAKNILVIKADEIGDVVLATGFLAAVRTQCSNARISLMVRGMCAELVRELGVVDEILILPEAWRGRGVPPRKVFEIAREAIKRWRTGAPDWVLIPRSAEDFSGAAYYAAWTGSAHVCAHEAFCRDGPRNLASFCRHVVPHSGWEHQVEDHRRMLRYLGLDDSDVEPRLVIPAAARSAVDQKLGAETLKRRTIAMCVGAGYPDKRWPLDRYALVTREILARHGDLQVVLIGAKGDNQDAESVSAVAPERVINACGLFSLLESAALLERCILYVGNDTGPMHIAATVGLPVIEICKHPITAGADRHHSPVRFGPRAVWSRIIQPEPLSEECRNGCDYEEAHCINAIAVEDVVQAIEEGLALGA